MLAQTTMNLGARRTASPSFHLFLLDPHPMVEVLELAILDLHGEPHHPVHADIGVDEVAPIALKTKHAHVALDGVRHHLL